MNTGLLRALRETQSSRDTEELLRVWVENDRGTYSEEMFEAVRSILADRRVTPPPQNPAPPFAARAPKRHPASQSDSEPDDPAWATWIRPILWIGAALGAAKLLSWIGLCLQYYEVYDQGGVYWSDWRLGAMVGELALSLALPCCLLAGVWAALRRRAAARRILFAYVVAALGLSGVRLAVTLYAASRSSFGMTGAYVLQQLESLLQANVYALVLLILLRRSGLLSFPAPVPAGFEVPPATEPVPGK